MNEQKRIEILAPAGGELSVRAAVCCGADAVYLGMGDFNARRNAANFTAEQLAETVAYCRERDVKVYLTLNTLFYDKETPEMVRSIQTACERGVDALIVQDLGVARLARAICPQVALHASTQMSVHSLEGVLMLEELGFVRCVLARELSLEEISAIAQKTSMELEVFVHGALCMSVSGQCQLSAMIGGRSGNRGLCAQPCRLPHTLVGEGRETGTHVLSLKDLSAIEDIPKLERAGVSSVKIEGRMKRPEYVAGAVTACREARDSALREETRSKLQAVFSRSGFTNGYLEGRRDGAMFGTRQKEDVLSAKGVLADLEMLYQKEPQRVPLRFRVEVRRNTAVRVELTDGVHTITMESSVFPQEAQSRSLDREALQKAFGKLGGTPYYLEAMECGLDEGLFLPVSEQNHLRRRSVELLAECRRRVAAPEMKQPPAEALELRAASLREADAALRGVFSDRAQLPEKGLDALAMLYLPVSELTAADETFFSRFEGRLGANLGRLTLGDERQTVHVLRELREKGVLHCRVSGLSGVRIARSAGMRVHLGHALNLTNSLSVAQAEDWDEVEDCTLSFEINADNLPRLAHGKPLGFVGYGYLPLMLLRNCPVHTWKDCAGCSGGSWSLKDRTGARMRLLCHKGYSELLNSVPLYVGDKLDRFRSMDFCELLFTSEGPEECERVLSLFENREPYPDKCTNGLYFRTIL